MSEQDFKIGDKVTAIYKTGKYIGEVTDIRPAAYLVKVFGCLEASHAGRSS